MKEAEAILKQRAMLDKIRIMEEVEETIEGIKIVKGKNVFYPHKDTILLAKSILGYSGKELLEVGTGSGFISIYLSKNAKSIDATDINPFSINLAKKNAKLNNSKNITFYLTDLFPLNKTYDLIVANLPYTNHPAKDVVEKSVWDKEHNTLKNFLKNVKKYLNNSGKIFLSWAEFADFDYFESLLKENNFSYNVVDEVLPYRVYQLS